MLLPARALWLAITRGILVALVLPLAFSSALPTYARLVTGHAAHVCQCERRAGHATCACPICHPDRDDLRLSEESIRGRCGDDDVVSGAALDVAIPPAFFAFFAPVSLRTSAPSPDDGRPLQIFVAPPTPPPRAARA